MNWAWIEEFNSISSSTNGIRFGLGFVTLFSLFFILIFHSLNRLSSYSPSRVSHNHKIEEKEQEIVSDDDLKFLIDNFGNNDDDNGGKRWDHVIKKYNSVLSYSAKCCKPKDAPLEYLSVTVFDNCSPEILRDFYMDNEYRKQWDKMILQHEQLHVDTANGTEVGRTIKKFPLFTPREYVLAWRLWEGSDQTYYCFIKDCEHSLAPQQRKYVRVRFFRSGWRIRKVMGRNAAEIMMFHQEDAGLNVEMAKLAFAKGIWSYVCKMEKALRGYSTTSQPHVGLEVTAASLIQKVPPGFETTDSYASNEANAVSGLATVRPENKLSRRPSRKVVANGLLLLGGIICLSRGHSSLGAKVAMGYVLTKLRKRDGQSNQSGERAEQ